MIQHKLNKSAHMVMHLNFIWNGPSSDLAQGITTMLRVFSVSHGSLMGKQLKLFADKTDLNSPSLSKIMPYINQSIIT